MRFSSHSCFGAQRRYSAFIAFTEGRCTPINFQDAKDKEEEEAKSKQSKAFAIEYKSMLGRFGGIAKTRDRNAVIDDVMSALWLPGGSHLVSGAPTGELLLWEGTGVCIKVCRC